MDNRFGELAHSLDSQFYFTFKKELQEQEQEQEPSPNILRIFQLRFYFD